MATDSRNKQQRSENNHPVERSSATPDDQSSPSTQRDWDRSWFAPFSIMRHGLDEMERSFGAAVRGEWEQLRRGWLSPGNRDLFSMGQQRGDWSPAIEAFQRGNEFIVRAEVPGLNRQDLHLEVGDDAVTIRGERKQDRREERDGVFWTERSYGSFTRVIPLPPGAITDSAKATFNNGVLEIVMPAPSAETRRGRRLDISESADEGKK